MRKQKRASTWLTLIVLGSPNEANLGNGLLSFLVNSSTRPFAYRHEAESPLRYY